MKLRVIGQSLQFNEDSAAVAGIDLGNGLAAVVMIMVTANKSTANAQGPSAGSQVLLAANATSGGRKAAIVANNGTTNLHIVIQASPGTGAAIGSESIVPPGSSWDAPEAYQGVVIGWWEGTPTGSASITELV